MAKTKTIFSCGSCGHEALKWLGKCPECGEFNTFIEVDKSGKDNVGSDRTFDESAISSLKDIETSEEERLHTGVGEIDRVFGGGIVKGSLVLMGGEPGVGKSTLSLVIAEKLAQNGSDVLYISGEESLKQIKLRADRMNVKSDNLSLVVETEVEKITAIIKEKKPGLVIVDSIQTVFTNDVDSAAGSVAQVKESCAHLMHAAKTSDVPIIIIGHVTKDGSIAGPKMLEHMVDAVMYFEAEKFYSFKILRAIKNRFGSTNEIGIFEMNSSGIHEVSNPSKILLENLKPEKTGSSIVTVMEGTRAIMLEIQALTSSRSFGNPQRTVTGVDYNRFLMILAILEKNLGLSFENHDTFLNVAGGIKIVETAADLAVAVAVYSGFTDKAVSMQTVYLGELGLDGEVRPGRFMEQRLSEASRMGFKTAIVPKGTKVKVDGINIKEIGSVKELSTLIGS